MYRARQHRFDESLFCNRWMVGEVKRAIAAGYSDAAHGSRVHVPKLNNLIGNIVRDPSVNHFAENAVMVSVGLLAVSGLDAARRFPLALDAMLCATQPQEELSDNDLHSVETMLESEINPIQLQYIMGDRSNQVKMKLLEKFRGYRDVLNQIIEKLERDLYGAKQ